MPTPERAVITIAGVKYTMAAQSQLPKGRRAITRRSRESQASDRGRLRTARWQLSGPIGASREVLTTGGEGFLGHDYSLGLDTYNDALLTSGIAVNDVTLTGSDPVGASGSAAFGGFAFGASGVKFGGPVGGQNVTHFDEDRAHLFAHRGRISTQVDPSDWGVIQGVLHDATVVGAAVWFGKGYLGQGGTNAMQRRLSVTASDATYEDVKISSTDVLAKELVVGNDRLWMVRASTTSANDNEARYTLDDFASISNSFIIGDPLIGGTGLGVHGPYALMGSEVGAYGFTDAGKPFNILRAVRSHRSQNNGRQWASIWGWAFTTTDIALYSMDPISSIANPAGIGSDRLRGFEGFSGRHTAIHEYREDLLDAVLTPAGHTHLLRGVFNPRNAPGQPDWYPFAYEASTEVHSIFGTSVPTNPTVVWGSGTNLAYVTRGRGGSDIFDSNYRFSVAGGTWFGTTLMRDQHMMKNVRLARFATENLVSSDSWQLAVSVDEGSYVNVGSSVTSDGYQVVRPVSGGVPLATVDGHAIKPRLTQVAGGSGSNTSPPQIRGTLEITYDERPDRIEEFDVVLIPATRGRSNRTDIDALLAQADPDTTSSPVTFRLPDRTSDDYGFVSQVSDIQDLLGDGVESVTVQIQVWETS